jgi:hypothetical protein
MLSLKAHYKRSLPAIRRAQKMAEVTQDHIRDHIPNRRPSNAVTGDLIAIVKAYLK